MNGACEYGPKNCDDENPCTDDICENGECAHPDTCDDTSDPTEWYRLTFTGIGGCPTSCTPDTSDPYLDYCGHTLTLTCKPTPLYGGVCAYEYWFNDTRVGLCVYTCGINEFQVKFNGADLCRVLSTRHRTQDELFPAGCDEGAEGKYDWQVCIYDAVSGTRYPLFCREGPSVGWESDGVKSDCEKEW